MKELLIVILAAPIALLVVLNNGLATLQTPVPITPRASPISVTLPAPPAAPTVVPRPSLPPVQGDILATARQWLGVPYLWGGCTPHGVDCSCFVRNVLAAVGISAPRTTTEQIRWALPITRSELQLGDLVFFDNTCTDCGPNPTHVGLAIGGDLMIDAGDPVRVESLETPYWRAHFRAAGRPHA